MSIQYFRAVVSCRYLLLIGEARPDQTKTRRAGRLKPGAGEELVRFHSREPRGRKVRGGEGLASVITQSPWKALDQILRSSAAQCSPVQSSGMKCIAVYCSALQCIAVH